MAKQEWGAPSEHKSFPAILLKADSDKGVVEHLIAVMGNIDLGDDRIMPGAFTKNISERGKKVKVLDLHNIGSIECVIGKPVQLKEIGKDELPPEVKEQYPEATGALHATTQFLMDTPEGKGAFIRIAAGAVDEWSFGYDATVKDFVEEEINGEEVNIRNLRELKLYEYSPVIFGMNPAPITISAKDVEGPGEGKPFPNEHACRLKSPGDFQEDSFRRTSRTSDGKKYSVIMGKLDGETTMTEQAYRYPKDVWNAKDAKAHCRAHGGGTFEAAQESSAVSQWGDGDATCMVVMFKANFDETFDNMLAQQEVMQARWRMEGAFYQSVESILTDEDITPQEKLGYLSITFDQYKSAFLGWAEHLMAIAKAEGSTVDFREGMHSLASTLSTLANILEATGMHKKGDDPAPGGAAGDHSDDTDGAGPSDQTPTLEAIEVAQVELRLTEIAAMDNQGGSK